MSTETIPSPAPKLHEIVDLSRLALVYLRNSLNNPRWPSGLDDYVAGGVALTSIPKLEIPKDVQSDEAALTWGAPTVDTFSVSDAVRDTCRKVLKVAFDQKTLAVNQHSVSLIHIFSLKS